MQRKLLGEAADLAGYKPGDSSIRNIEDTVLSKNADASAALLSEISGYAGDSVRLISDPAALEPLDRAVRDLDLPSVGSATRSSLGTLIQLAPVLLRLHWGPFNPQAWLEFFLHPVRPLSPKLAGNLAFAINQWPSRENPAWNRAIEKP